MEGVLFEVVSRDARPHPEERACRKGPANWHACTRVSKDEDGTDLGFTRDRQNSVPKSATADLGALMLRDASRRTWAVEAPALASGRNAPQHEGEGGATHFGQTKPSGEYACLVRANDQPAAVQNDRRRRFTVSGLLFTMTFATRTCRPH